MEQTGNWMSERVGEFNIARVSRTAEDSSKQRLGNWQQQQQQRRPIIN